MIFQQCSILFVVSRKQLTKQQWFSKIMISKLVRFDKGREFVVKIIFLTFYFTVEYDCVHCRILSGFLFTAAGEIHRDCRDLLSSGHRLNDSREGLLLVLVFNC